jgi:hypothetical protein
MIVSRPRRASAGEAASSNVLHQRALTSVWWRSGSFEVTFLRACTVQRCSSARGPQLADRLPQPGGTVGADEPRGVHSPEDQVAAEGQPRLVALPRAELQTEQDFAALPASRPRQPTHPPRACHPGAASGKSHRGTGTRGRAHPAAACTTGLAPARVLQHSRDRRLGDHRLIEGLLQGGLDIAHRQAAKERADHQRLQRVGARDSLAEDP